MLLKLIDQRIRKAFSSAAMQYDVLTSLHKEIGRDLIKKVVASEPCRRILDVGMGTGWLTHRLHQHFPGSMVVGVDFAPGMIEAAQIQNEDNFKIVEAHAGELPFKPESFDLIVSNLAYHWMESLPQAFSQCFDKLTKGGSLSLTMCGRQTFTELFSSLENSRPEMEKLQPLPIFRLPDTAQIENSLQQAGFEKIELTSERIRIRFQDMMSLIKWTRDIGANALAKDIYIGKEWLAKANDYYDQHFKDEFGIQATFEVVWVVARK